MGNEVCKRPNRTRFDASAPGNKLQHPEAVEVAFSPLHRQARARREYDSYMSIHSEIYAIRVGQKVSSVRVTRSVKLQAKSKEKKSKMMPKRNRIHTR